MQTGTYIPIGLDAATMTLQFLASGPDENGGCGVAYSVSVPGLDLTSPANGNQPLSLMAGTVSAFPPDTFFLSGIYHELANDVTVVLGIQLPAMPTQSGFDQLSTFNVYSGNQVVSVPCGPTPDELCDAVNPAATLVSSGSLVLSFVKL